MRKSRRLLVREAAWCRTRVVSGIVALGLAAGVAWGGNDAWAGPVGKSPVPDESASVRARTRLEDLYKVRLLTKAEEKRALAAKLLIDSAGIKDDALSCYAMLSMAVDMFQEAGDLRSGMRVIDSIAERFDIDTIDAKAGVLRKYVESHRVGKTDILGLSDAVAEHFALIDEALTQDRYELAQDVSKRGAVLAKRLKDPVAVREYAMKDKEIARTLKEYEQVQKALKSLTKEPHDHDAHQRIGMWLCLRKDRWKDGLMHLQYSTESAISLAAKADIANPADAETRIAVGDAWFRLGESKAMLPAGSAFARAMFWYQAAISGVTGVDKIGLGKKIEEAASRQFQGIFVQGAFQGGNVALASNGTRVSEGGGNVATMLDGDYRFDPTVVSGYANANWPCEWTIMFAKPYRLREIRIRLVGSSSDYYHYKVALSLDGTHFSVVTDRSQGMWRDWQQVSIAPTAVKAVKVIGLYHNGFKDFGIAEFEAYCIPPGTLPK